METGKTVAPFARELRERAARMMREHREAHGSQRVAHGSIAARIGVRGETPTAAFGRRNEIEVAGPVLRRRSVTGSRRRSARSARFAGSMRP